MYEVAKLPLLLASLGFPQEIVVGLSAGDDLRYDPLVVPQVDTSSLGTWLLQCRRLSIFMYSCMMVMFKGVAWWVGYASKYPTHLSLGIGQLMARRVCVPGPHSLARHNDKGCDGL